MVCGAEDSKITVSEKQILITKWCGNAYHCLNTFKYDSFRWRLFKKAGCLITTDSLNDNKINPEGLPNYVVPAPSALEPAVDHILPSNKPEDVGVPEEFNENIFDVSDKITIFHYTQTFQIVTA